MGREHHASIERQEVCSVVLLSAHRRFTGGGHVRRAEQFLFLSLARRRKMRE
jgi:hypothetical protein